jgi:hypothetical protein
MIRINLAKKTGKASAGGGGKFDLKSLNLSALLEMLKTGDDGEGKKFDINGPVPRLLISFVVCYYVDDTLTAYRAEELKKVEAEISVVEKQKDEISRKLSKIKGFEPVKKQLEEDEKAIRLKLDVVNRLMEDRNAPSKMMMQIAQSIPDEVWLNSLTVTDDKVEITGSTPGYNQVSDFIKALNSTSQFTDINLSGIQESNSGQATQRVQNFDLVAARRKGN